MRVAATIVFTLLAGAAMAQPTPPAPGDFPPDTQESPSGPPAGQMPPPPSQTPPPAYGRAPPGPHGRMNGRERFEAANLTHDGRLTRDQAQQARWMVVARHFGEIDTDRKGYITLQDLREWTRARRAARLQRQGAPPQYQGAPPSDPAAPPPYQGPPPPAPQE